MNTNKEIEIRWHKKVNADEEEVEKKWQNKILMLYIIFQMAWAKNIQSCENKKPYEKKIEWQCDRDNLAAATTPYHNAFNETKISTKCHTKQYERHGEIL